MDARAAIPPTLPRPNPTVSYWQDPPDAIADLRSTVDLPETADVVIIGSGISGATIAYDLLERGGGERVVMLEARNACSAATGRNGGHTKGGTYRSFLSCVESLGVEEAVKIVRLEYNCIKAIHAFARAHNIDCDLFSGDTVDIVYDEGKWDQARKSVELMRKLMPDDLNGAANYTFYTAEEAQTQFHCYGDRPVGALKYPAGSLSAYKLVIGILKLSLSKGLNLQANTPAVELRRSDIGEWQVQTSRGLITAKKVVLATNGYTGYLFKPLSSVIVPLRGQITAHRPGSSMPKEGLKTTYSFVYSDGYEYMISRPPGTKFEGDIVIGGGLAKAAEKGIFEYGTSDDTSLNADVSRYLTETTPRYFGKSWGDDDPQGRIRKEWTGIMGYSPDGFPFVGKVPNNEGLYISASFQGHGMVLCFLCAKALVQIMLDKDGEEGLNDWFPTAFRITSERMNKRFQGRLHT